LIFGTSGICLFWLPVDVRSPSGDSIHFRDWKIDDDDDDNNNNNDRQPRAQFAVILGFIGIYEASAFQTCKLRHYATLA
jgi:hypothetical protein